MTIAERVDASILRGRRRYGLAYIITINYSDIPINAFRHVQTRDDTFEEVKFEECELLVSPSSVAAIAAACGKSVIDDAVNYIKGAEVVEIKEATGEKLRNFTVNTVSPLRHVEPSATSCVLTLYRTPRK